MHAQSVENREQIHEESEDEEEYYDDERPPMLINPPVAREIEEVPDYQTDTTLAALKRFGRFKITEQELLDFDS